MLCHPESSSTWSMGPVSSFSATPRPNRSTAAPIARTGLNVLAACEGVESTTRLCDIALPSHSRRMNVRACNMRQLLYPATQHRDRGFGQDKCGIGASGDDSGGRRSIRVRVALCAFGVPDIL